MDDLISRQSAIDEFDDIKFDIEYCTEYGIGFNDGIDFAVSRLSVLPSAQKVGKWIYTPIEPLGYICSECRIGCCRFNYCPNCGARMESE